MQQDSKSNSVQCMDALVLHREALLPQSALIDVFERQRFIRLCACVAI